MNKERENILNSAREIFLQRGFYKTPMDEIAGELKISKKTIYKHFSSKEELVSESLMNFLAKNHQRIGEIISSNISAVEKSFLMFNHVSKILVKLSENFLTDIRNFMPDLWKEIDTVRSKILYENLKLIIEQGQKEGLFIETESEMLVTIFIVSIRGVLNPDSLIANKISAPEAADSIIEILMNGILTDKGRKVYKNLKSGEDK